jgi:hypothetical protein
MFKAPAVDVHCGSATGKPKAPRLGRAQLDRERRTRKRLDRERRTRKRLDRERRTRVRKQL